MQMIARIRTVIDVPFDFDVQPPDENGNSPTGTDAAHHAIDTLLPHIVELINAEGDVQTDLNLVEEVREA